MDVAVRASAIEGLGLVAARALRAGDRIRRVNVVREITADAPLREDLGERQDHCDYPDGRVVLLGFPDRHVNHSCDPSAYVLYEGDAVWLVARRDTAVGDEITCDYNINTASGSSWPCHCGAARCRGATGGDFFLLPAAIQGNTDRYWRTGSCDAIGIGSTRLITSRMQAATRRRTA